jgi:hypothetical protein
MPGLLFLRRSRGLYIQAAEGSSVPNPYSPPPLMPLRRLQLRDSNEKSSLSCRRIRASASSTSTGVLAPTAAGGETVGLAAATRCRAPRSSARKRSGRNGTTPKARESVARGGGPIGGSRLRRSSPATPIAARALPPEVRAGPWCRPSTIAVRGGGIARLRPE